MAIAVLDDIRPVSIDVPDPDARVVVRRLDGETQGAPQSFGPFAEGIRLTTGAGTADVGPIPGADPDPTPTPTTTPAVTGTATPAPTTATPDRTAPRVRATVRRRGRRFKVTVRATDPSGVRRIEYRFGKKGRWRTYRRPLRVTRARLRTLRVRATDRAGNRSRPLSPRIGRSG